MRHLNNKMKFNQNLKKSKRSNRELVDLTLRTSEYKIIKVFYTQNTAVGSTAIKKEKFIYTFNDYFFKLELNSARYGNKENLRVRGYDRKSKNKYASYQVFTTWESSPSYKKT